MQVFWYPVQRPNVYRLYIVPSIALELAARFCTDSLRESYFGWDRTRFASASAHNQARTRGQLQVAEGVLVELPALSRLTAAAFRR